MTGLRRLWWRCRNWFRRPRGIRVVAIAVYRDGVGCSHPLPRPLWLQPGDTLTITLGECRGLHPAQTLHIPHPFQESFALRVAPQEDYAAPSLP